MYQKKIIQGIDNFKNKKYKEGLQSVHGHENIISLGIGFKGKQLMLREFN